jgi:RNA polymerase sigma-70 factor, ECF subfamily
VADTTVGFQFAGLTQESLTQESLSAGNAALPVARDDDRALVEGLRAAEETAYEALILRFEQPVFNLVCRLLDNPADAADVVQEVFLKVFRNIDGFRADSSLKTWVYRIAVNEARNQHRWFMRHRGKEVELDPFANERAGAQNWLPDPGRNPYEATLDHENQTLVESALSKVSPNHRAALVLREIEGLSYEEIAHFLGISLGTVKSRILRGRESLREHLTASFRTGLQPGWSLDFRPQGSDAL